MIEVSDASIDPGADLTAFQTEANGAGGIVSFSGVVRDTASSGDVSALFLQSYSPMTENGIQNAVDEAQSRWPLTAVLIKHRIGQMAPGDTIVFVATASAHRRAAFEAADFLMDYLKTKAVFWKKETTADGDKWIEPRSEDYQDSARWDKPKET